MVAQIEKALWLKTNGLIFDVRGRARVLILVAFLMLSTEGATWGVASKQFHAVMDDYQNEKYTPCYLTCDLFIKLYLIAIFDPLTKFKKISIEHLQWCGIPTEDAYSSGYLLWSHLGPNIQSKCSNIERNLCKTCPFRILNFKHPSVQLFYFVNVAGADLPFIVDLGTYSYSGVVHRKFV